MIFYLFQFDLFCRCVIPFLHKNTSWRKFYELWLFAGCF
jgi:hypothetical protein